jgi:hypothetical protein
MNSGIENHVDWTAPSLPEGERLAQSAPARKPVRPATSQPRVATRGDVMNLLLGASKLSAADISGADPYNATGRHFRR